MLNEVKILVARRAYEFEPDQIRLTLLTVPTVHQAIQQAFGFQVVQIATPGATFGPVTETFPPGLVFAHGVIVRDDGQPVPIRLLNVEQRRLVFDIAGPSSAIDAIYTRLRHMLADVRAPDGSPVVGEPSSIRDYSEITALLPMELGSLIPQPLREVYRRHLSAGDETHEVLTPALYVSATSSEGQYAGVDLNASATSTYILAPRSGSRPSSNTYFSAAPLPTDSHISYLTEVEAILASQPS